MTDPTTPARLAELQDELEGFVRGSELTIRERLEALERNVQARIHLAEGRIQEHLGRLEDSLQILLDDRFQDEPPQFHKRRGVKP